MSLRLDMTPMVDLAFLLLTFFMLTTTFSKPLAMELQMPEQSDPTKSEPLLNYQNVLTLVLGAHNQVFWYKGDNASLAKSTNYAANGIRKLLLTHRNNPRLWVFIKPDDRANYQNIVDALDEMAIAGIARYSIADMTSSDRTSVQLVSQLKSSY